MNKSFIQDVLATENFFPTPSVRPSWFSAWSTTLDAAAKIQPLFFLHLNVSFVLHRN